MSSASPTFSSMSGSYGRADRSLLSTDVAQCQTPPTWSQGGLSLDHLTFCVSHHAEMTGDEFGDKGQRPCARSGDLPKIPSQPVRADREGFERVTVGDPAKG